MKRKNENLRQAVIRHCVLCGTIFAVGKIKNKIYCTRKCNKKAGLIAFRKRNPGYFTRKSKEFFLKNPGYNKERCKVYYAKNRLKEILRKREYYRKHKKLKTKMKHLAGIIINHLWKEYSKDTSVIYNKKPIAGAILTVEGFFLWLRGKNNY